MAARLTPDQKVGSSNLSGLINLCGSQDQARWKGKDKAHFKRKAVTARLKQKALGPKASSPPGFRAAGLLAGRPQEGKGPRRTRTLNLLICGQMRRRCAMDPCDVTEGELLKNAACPL